MLKWFMISLVIPDVHHRWNIVEKIENRHPDVDEVIFLGDYHDDWNDNPLESARTAVKIQQRLENPKNIMLVGNHDMPYWNSSDFYQCPGWTKHKHAAAKEVMNSKDWQKCRFFHQSQGWLFSHAGFDQRHAHPVLEKNFQKIETDLYSAMKSNIGHRLLSRGKDRGGDERVGGINWIDVRYITPAAGFKQVVGHTPDYFPVVGKAEDWEENGSRLVCLDTRGMVCYGMIIDGQLQYLESMSGIVMGQA